ncbi:MAG: VanZ family protein [Desulfobacterales bacterium]|nr:VanZ family protein [Desulfobacterales bacterium]
MLPRLMRMLPDLAPLIAYCTFIVIQSHLPSPVELPEVSHVDKLLHAGAYGVMAVLFYRTYLAGWPQAGRRALVWASVASAALFGLSDEIHQFFVPERTADPLDFLADTPAAPFWERPPISACSTPAGGREDHPLGRAAD